MPLEPYSIGEIRFIPPNNIAVLFDSNGYPIGPISLAGSFTPSQVAAIQAANAPSGANPFATIADVGGGAGVEVIDLPFAWDDVPAKNGGVLLWQPLEGDSILSISVHVSIVFNGTSPGALIYWDDGKDPYLDGDNTFLIGDLTKVDADTGLGSESPGAIYSVGSYSSNSVPGAISNALKASALIIKATPPAIKVAVGSQSTTFDPLDSTTGVGLVRLIVVHAP